jgi:hypothetical protein
MRFTFSVALGLCLALAASGVRSAVAQTPLDTGYHQMYDLQFPAAHRTFAECERIHPDDAMGPVSDAAAWLFAEFDRLHILQSQFFLHDDDFRKDRHLTPDPTAAREFSHQLDRARALSDATLARAPRDRNALLASMLVLGLRSDYEGLIEERYMSALKTSRKSRQLAERILTLDPDCYDAWVAIGVENYVLSFKPTPVRWFVQLLGNSADREYGLAKLRLTAERGHYLQPFAQLLLAVAALRAKHPDEARGLLTHLAEQYPHNRLYAEELARLQPGSWLPDTTRGNE